MSVTLLLADPYDPAGVARAVPLQLQLLHTAPGGEDVTVTFRPNRTDDLHSSAKTGAELAYRILFREGVVRSQLVVRCQLPDAPVNVVGRSADLAFALAIPLQAYEERDGSFGSGAASRPIAATGVLEPDGTVRKVEHLPPKLRAALGELGTRGLVFFPAENLPEVEQAGFLQEGNNGQLRPIRHVDEALEQLGIVLERVYLRNPFRGLEHFEYAHHSIFFGRDREVRDLVQQLLRREAAGRPGAMVEGPSGSGKSSFLRAGVLPALVNPRDQPQEVRGALAARPVSVEVRKAIWRPGLMPYGIDEEGIARSIRECWGAYSEVPADWLARHPDALNEPETLSELAHRRRACWPASRRFVWLIDQLEEILALGLDPVRLESLGEFLKQLQADGAWTVVSIRSDALPQLKCYEAFRHVFGANEGQYYLSGLRGLALDEVITAPAKAADLTFGMAPDGARLDQLLRDEAYREDDCLPLLQFTLNELYVRRSGQELTYATYRQLGGLAGSVARTAEAILTMESVDSARTASRLFRSLVRVDETGRALRRYAPRVEIARDSRQQALVSRLIEARLCLSDHREGEAVVAFAHDSLLRTLPALTDWLREEGALIQTRELAQREARLWQEHGRSNAWLAGADKLVAYETLEAAEIALSPDVREFVDHSRRQVRRTTRLKQATVAAIALLALAASAAAWIALNREKEAQFQTAQAREANLQLLTQSAAERLKDGDLTLARSIELEVLRRRDPRALPDPAAMNVLQEVRASDPALAILAGHSGGVRQVSYSPDGLRILTASDDNTARIWDARTGVQLALLAPGSSVCSAVYSSDGRRVLTASDDGKNRIWDANSAIEVGIVPGHVGHCGFAFPVDGGRFLTSDGKGPLQVWDARTGRLLVELARPPGVGFLAADLSPDGTQLVLAADDNTARVWNVLTGKQVLILSGHLADVTSVRYSPDGRRIVTTSQDNTARIWDASNGEQLAQVAHIGMVFDAAFSPDGKTLATASADLTARVWDIATGKQLQLFSGHTVMLWGVAYSPDGTRLVTGALDGTARTWRLRQQYEARVLGNSAYKFYGASYSPDSSRIVTLSENGPPRLWDAHSGALVAEWSGLRDVHRVAVYSPDGAHILASVASVGNVMKIWDAMTGSTVLDIPGPAPVTDALDYSPDGRRIAAAFEDYSLQVRDATTGKLLVTGRPGKTVITSLQFSPEGRRILTGSLDSAARIYDADSLRQLKIFRHKDVVRHAAWSPDGSRIVTACHDGLAYVWDANTGEKVQTLAGHHAYVWGAAFSPDGSTIVTGGRDQTVRIWDARTGIELAVLTGHQGRIESVAYSPDGKHILSTSSLDSTARVWDARIPADWRSQILWQEAVEADSLSDVQRTTLGIATTEHVLTGRALTATTRSAGTVSVSRDACSQQAAAYYDPDRTAPGLEQAVIEADLALPACSAGNHNDRSGRISYQRGRALFAKGDADGARKEWEIAVAHGYRAAHMDLALLLVDPTRRMRDPTRAALLLQTAWRSGIATAAYELGKLYESGVSTQHPASALRPDDAKATYWYGQAVSASEPHALAREAQRAERQALSMSTENSDAKFLEAFTLYARAVRQAQAQNWPDGVWRTWRYRRSTLARVLAADGKMQQVADAYDQILEDRR